MSAALAAFTSVTVVVMVVKVEMEAAQVLVVVAALADILVLAAQEAPLLERGLGKRGLVVVLEAAAQEVTLTLVALEAVLTYMVKEPMVLVGDLYLDPLQYKTVFLALGGLGAEMEQIYQDPAGKMMVVSMVAAVVELTDQDQAVDLAVR